MNARLERKRVVVGLLLLLGVPLSLVAFGIIFGAAVAACFLVAFLTLGYELGRPHFRRRLLERATRGLVYAASASPLLIVAALAAISFLDRLDSRAGEVASVTVFSIAIAGGLVAAWLTVRARGNPTERRLLRTGLPWAVAAPPSADRSSWPLTSSNPHHPWPSSLWWGFR